MVKARDCNFNQGELDRCGNMSEGNKMLVQLHTYSTSHSLGCTWKSIQCMQGYYRLNQHCKSVTVDMKWFAMCSIICICSFTTASWHLCCRASSKRCYIGWQDTVSYKTWLAVCYLFNLLQQGRQCFIDHGSIGERLLVYNKSLVSNTWLVPSSFNIYIIPTLRLHMLQKLAPRFGLTLAPSSGQIMSLLCRLADFGRSVLGWRMVFPFACHIHQLFETETARRLKIQPWVRAIHSSHTTWRCTFMPVVMETSHNFPPFFPHFLGVWKTVMGKITHGNTTCQNNWFMEHNGMGSLQ